MNRQLQNALSELRAAGAQGSPDVSVIERAPNGTSWQGKKTDGNPWKLTKNSEESYNCMC